jgi:hypothetical protein
LIVVRNFFFSFVEEYSQPIENIVFDIWYIEENIAIRQSRWDLLVIIHRYVSKKFRWNFRIIFIIDWMLLSNFYMIYIMLKFLFVPKLLNMLLKTFKYKQKICEEEDTKIFISSLEQFWENLSFILLFIYISKRNNRKGGEIESNWTEQEEKDRWLADKSIFVTFSWYELG